MDPSIASKLLSQEQINQLGEAFGFGTMVDDEILWFDGNPTELIRAAVLKALEGAHVATFEHVTNHVSYIRSDDYPFLEHWDRQSVLILRIP